MLETTQQNPLVATDDIVCYKTVRTVISRDSKKTYVLSNVVGYQYTVGEKNPEIDVHVDDTVYTEVDKTHFRIVKAGYHAYKNVKDIVVWGEGAHIRKCIIPKGSRYFEDTNGRQYCASNIIIGEIWPLES